jgi:hypothetical protein
VGGGLRYGIVAGACVAFVLALSGSALGRATADDLSVLVHFVRDSRATTTTQLANDIAFELFTDGPSQAVTMRYSLPAGLVFGDDVPDPSENCTNGPTVVCALALTPSNNLQAGWSWPVIASAPGTYSITATVEGERPDAVPANNTATFTFEIKPASAGSATVSVSAPKATPANARAGRPVTFTSTVRVDGVAAKPSKVTCTGTLGGRKATGVPRSATGIASCRYATRKTDKGKRLAGSMKVTAGGKTLTKRFAARLG